MLPHPPPVVIHPSHPPPRPVPSVAPEKRTDPSARRRQQRSTGIVPALVVFFAILVLGAVAVFWLWRRQHP
jgi:hypothetical protein